VDLEDDFSEWEQSPFDPSFDPHTHPEDFSDVDFRYQFRPRRKFLQTGDHERFLERMAYYEFSPHGESVLLRIFDCGADRGRNAGSSGRGRQHAFKKRKRCGYPLCPTCGQGGKYRSKAREIADWARSGADIFGPDHVSYVTIDAPVCCPTRVVETMTEFRDDLKEFFQKVLGNTNLKGEFELYVRVSSVDLDSGEVIWEELGENKVKLPDAFDGEKPLREQFKWPVGMEDSEQKVCRGTYTTGVLGLLPHVHLFLIHPTEDRKTVRALLKEWFPGNNRVSVLPIQDRKGWDGKVWCGFKRIANYLSDKSSAVKGGDRGGEIGRDFDPVAQAVIYDAYCEAMKGQKRRLKIEVRRPLRTLPAPQPMKAAGSEI
jgi:hypothetical protein